MDMTWRHGEKNENKPEGDPPEKPPAPAPLPVYLEAPFPAPSSTYLGDGVYAEFDGYHIMLDLRGQDSTTKIALEPSVMNALHQYAKRCWG